MINAVNARRALAPEPVLGLSDDACEVVDRCVVVAELRMWSAVRVGQAAVGQLRRGGVPGGLGSRGDGQLSDGWRLGSVRILGS